jgi:hypothetical protein
VAVLGGLFVVALTQVPAAAQAPVSALAQPIAPAGGVLVRATARLDCASLSPRGHQYAAAHHLCTTPTGGTQPQSIVDNSCGSSWLWISNPLVGRTNITYGFDSTLGPIVHRELSVQVWFTHPNNSIDNFTIPDFGFMLASRYQTVWGEQTGPGGAAAQLTGTVELAIGGYCFITLPFPKDFMVII